MARSDCLSVSALSALTWSAEDRRAWNEAYRHARRIDRRRRARERAAADRFMRLHYVPTDAERHSVHVDVMGERGQ